MHWIFDKEPNDASCVPNRICGCTFILERNTHNKMRSLKYLNFLSRMLNHTRKKHTQNITSSERASLFMLRLGNDQITIYDKHEICCSMEILLHFIPLSIWLHWRDEVAEDITTNLTWKLEKIWNFKKTFYSLFFLFKSHVKNDNNCWVCFVFQHVFNVARKNTVHGRSLRAAGISKIGHRKTAPYRSGEVFQTNELFAMRISRFRLESSKRVL